MHRRRITRANGKLKRLAVARAVISIARARGWPAAPFVLAIPISMAVFMAAVFSPNALTAQETLRRIAPPASGQPGTQIPTTQAQRQGTTITAQSRPASGGTRSTSRGPGPTGDTWLTYAVSLAGLPVAEANIFLRFSDQTYNGVLEIQTSGLASLFTDWQFRSESAGRKNDAVLLPNEHITRSERRDRVRQVEIFYGANGIDEIIADPPQSLDADRSPLTVDMQAGTIDLMSALMTLYQGKDNGAPCIAPLPVHDGRHRFDIVAEPLGSTQVSGALYRGPATGCRLRVLAIGGFKQGDDDFSFDKVYETWFADPLGNGMQIITSAETVLSFGRAFVTLTAIRDFDGRSLYRGR
jgi:hypothetical protein